MRTWQRSIARLLPSLALLLLAAGLGFGCYKPNITDGGLRCNLDAGAGAKACPDGFRCNLPDQRCYRNPDGGADRTDVGETGGDAPDADGPPCFDAKPACTPGSGMCDPACQSGCGCRQKCSVNAAIVPVLTCNAPRMQGFPKTLGQDCTIESAGSGIQTDNCDNGLVCIEDGCFARCFQFCKSDGECVNSACTRDVGGGQKVCDVPFVDTCVPLPSGGNTGCSGGAMACYISSGSPTHTICDCPMNAKGPNEDCTRSRECLPGLACVDRQTGASPKCLQVCRLALNGGDCPPPSTPGSCRPYLGIPPGSVAHATFGFCF